MMRISDFLPEGRCGSADIAAAVEVAGATRLALIAAWAGIEDWRRQFEARGDREGSALLGDAVLKLRGRAVEVFNIVADLKALDPNWSAERDRALERRLEAMAADAKGGRWLIDQAETFVKLAMLEIRLAAHSEQDAEVAHVG